MPRSSTAIDLDPTTPQHRVKRMRITQSDICLPSHENVGENAMIIASDRRVTELEDEFAREKAHLKKLRSTVVPHIVPHKTHLTGADGPLASTHLEASCYGKYARETSLAQLDRDVAFLNGSILELKTRHNSLFSITSRMPPELLEQVFKWLMAMSLEQDEDDLDAMGTSWVKTSFVCSHWRRIALRCQDLWVVMRQTPDGINLEWLLILSARSRAAPLHINLRLDDLCALGKNELRIQVYQFIKEHMHRIQVLLFSDLQDHCKSKKSLSILSETAAPQLKHLRLNIDGSLETTFPDKKFSCLQQLSLYGCMVSPKSSFLPGLKSLSLTFSTGTRTITLSNVLRALQSACKLETLTLDGPSVSPSDVNMPTVYLPSLTTLKILSKFCEKITTMLRHINHPSSTRVFLCPNAYIHAPLRRSEETAAPQRLAALIASRVSVQRLCFEIHTKFFDMQLSTNKGNPSDDTVGCVNLRLSRYPEDIMFRAFCGTLAQLETLVIASPRRFTSFSLAFGSLPKLRTIIFCGDPLGLLEDFGQNATVQEAAKPTCRISFESLRVLKIEGWTFDKGSIYPLVTSFQTRKTRGVRLQVMAIVQGKFCGKESKVKSIEAKVRSLAENVIWDVETSCVQGETEPIEGTWVTKRVLACG